jgi:hypothetical protein
MMFDNKKTAAILQEDRRCLSGLFTVSADS